MKNKKVAMQIRIHRWVGGGYVWAWEHVVDTCSLLPYLLFNLIHIYNVFNVQQIMYMHIITLSFPQPSPARKASTKVQRPPEPGKPATPLPNTAKTERPSTKKERFSVMYF